MNDQYVKHVGFENSAGSALYFSPANVARIQAAASEMLKDVHAYGVTIPCEHIAHVMSDIFESYRPPTGDIYSRYIVPNPDETPSYVDDMTMQVLRVVTQAVRDDLGTIDCNSKLDIWTSLYGDFNTHGLRQHDVLKMQMKRPEPFLFNMNY